MLSSVELVFISRVYTSVFIDHFKLLFQLSFLNENITRNLGTSLKGGGWGECAVPPFVRPWARSLVLQEIAVREK